MLVHYNLIFVLLFWAPQIAVNRLIFSYFHFVNKQPVSNFQHIMRKSKGLFHQPYGSNTNEYSPSYNFDISISI